MAWTVATQRRYRPRHARKLIARRLSVGLARARSTVALSAVLDLAIRPGGFLPVAWIYGADFALVFLVQLASRHPQTRAHIIPVAVLAVILWNALFCSYAALSPREIPVPIAPSIVIVTAAACCSPGACACSRSSPGRAS